VAKLARWQTKLPTKE
jgi:DNA-binding MarR family transcriptional regulator